MGKIRVHRRAYTRKDGTRVKEASFLAKDTGKKGRTPKSKRWARFETETGWEKTMPAGKRRRLVLKAHKGDYLAAGRAMQQLANVMTDRRTEELAGRDARHFFREHRKRK